MEVVAAGVLGDVAVGEDVGEGEELAEGAADGVGGLVGMAFAGGGHERDGGGSGGEVKMTEAAFVDGDDGFEGAALELGAEGFVAHGLAGFAVEHIDGEGLGGGLGDGLARLTRRLFGEHCKIQGSLHSGGKGRRLRSR